MWKPFSYYSSVYSQSTIYTYIDPEGVFLEVFVLDLIVVHGVGVEPDQGDHQLSWKSHKYMYECKDILKRER